MVLLYVFSLNICIGCFALNDRTPVFSAEPIVLTVDKSYREPFDDISCPAKELSFEPTGNFAGKNGTIHLRMSDLVSDAGDIIQSSDVYLRINGQSTKANGNRLIWNRNWDVKRIVIGVSLDPDVVNKHPGEYKGKIVLSNTEHLIDIKVIIAAREILQYTPDSINFFVKAPGRWGPESTFLKINCNLKSWKIYMHMPVFQQAGQNGRVVTPDHFKLDVTPVNTSSIPIAPMRVINFNSSSDVVIYEVNDSCADSNNVILRLDFYVDIDLTTSAGIYSGQVISTLEDTSCWGR